MCLSEGVGALHLGMGCATKASGESRGEWGRGAVGAADFVCVEVCLWETGCRCEVHPHKGAQVLACLRLWPSLSACLCGLRAE